MTPKQNEIIHRAAGAIHKVDRLRLELREAEAALKSVCREYSEEMRIWGYTPDMMRRVVESTIVEAA